MLLEEFPFEPGFRLTDGDLLNKVAAEPAYSVDNTVTATGTTQALAYGIRATVTVVTAGGDNAGLRLPFPKVGRIIFVLNYTATGKRVYPHDAELINGVGFADMPFQMGMVLICTSAGSWAASLTETNTSGDIILVASDADTPTGDGHFVDIEGGAGGTTSGNGGPVTIKSGSATGTLGDAGDITIQGGVSTNGKGGDIVVAAGKGTTNGTVTITPAVSVGVAPNNVLTVTPGATVADPITMVTSGTGPVTVVGGNSPAGPVMSVTQASVTQPAGLVLKDVQIAVQGQDTHSSAVAINSVGTGSFSGLQLRSVLGTSAAPVPLGASGVMGAVQFGSFDGSAWNGAAISINGVIEAGNAWTLTSNPARLIWRTTPVGSTSSVAVMALTAAGNLNITSGAGAPDTGFKLNVNGNTRVVTGLGVWNTTPPVSQPTITGSRGGNAALTMLLTALAATGIIVDSTTA